MLNTKDSPFTVLVTGANSGLGFAICQRLIDDFLNTRAKHENLLIIPTTRSSIKAEATIAQLSQYVVNHAHAAEKKEPGVRKTLEDRVRLQPEILDLNSLRSVRELAQRLRGDNRIVKIDRVILNAGLGAWVGIDWSSAIWGILTDLIYQITWPPFKVSQTGQITKLQLPEPAPFQEKSPSPEPKLGLIFCSNVFGHYVLVHELVSLLTTATSSSPTRIIWISSLEAYAHAFDVHNDLQGLRAALPYESSKRLTDVLALTSHLPCTSPWTKPYLAPDGPLETAAKPPKMFTAHPGVCATAILPLPFPLTYAMIALFYLARWLGSVWHTIQPYKGAKSAVWLALAPDEKLDEIEAPSPHDVPEGQSVHALTEAQRASIRRPGKWGTQVLNDGDERFDRTEVEGWGWDGRPGLQVRRLRGRQRGARAPTAEGRKDFEGLGAACWREMEGLRLAWTKRLDDAGV